MTEISQEHIGLPMASGRQVILIHRVGEEPVFPQFEGSDDEDEY